MIEICNHASRTSCFHFERKSTNAILCTLGVKRNIAFFRTKLNKIYPTKFTILGHR